jgi:hypothetical protein
MPRPDPPHTEPNASHRTQQMAPVDMVVIHDGRLLRRLDKLEPSDPNYADLLPQVIADGREHIAYEEEQVWP